MHLDQPVAQSREGMHILQTLADGSIFGFLSVSNYGFEVSFFCGNGIAHPVKAELHLGTPGKWLNLIVTLLASSWKFRLGKVSRHDILWCSDSVYSWWLWFFRCLISLEYIKDAYWKQEEAYWNPHWHHKDSAARTSKHWPEPPASSPATLLVVGISLVPLFFFLACASLFVSFVSPVWVNWDMFDDHASTLLLQCSLE